MHFCFLNFITKKHKQMKIDWNVVLSVVIGLVIFTVIEKPVKSGLSKVGMWESE